MPDKTHYSSPNSSPAASPPPTFHHHTSPSHLKFHQSQEPTLSSSTSGLPPLLPSLLGHTYQTHPPRSSNSVSGLTSSSLLLPNSSQCFAITSNNSSSHSTILPSSSFIPYSLLSNKFKAVYNSCHPAF